jgi:alpha-beta hydrolase superfamily lysophospholipase
MTRDRSFEETLWLDGPEGREAVALRFEAPADRRRPALLYLHGFGSHQEGEKAVVFRRRARRAGLGFCSFDFRGHGRSGGGMERLTMSRNLDDAEAAAGWLAERWEGPLAFFGSSMGAAAAMWLAALRREGPAARLAAGVAIAPALGLERGLAAQCGEAGLARWRESGFLRVDNPLVSCRLGWALMEDLARHRPAALPPRYATPTLVLQGTADDSVPWREAADFAAACRRGLVEVHLFAGGDHRLIPEVDRIWQLAAGFVEGHLGPGAGTSLAPPAGEEEP